MFHFVRKTSLKSYQVEFKNYADYIVGMSDEDVAEWFVISVWTRAGMQSEGHFTFSDGYVNDSAQLTGYPVMISQFLNIIKVFEKEGLKKEGYVLYIWVHSLRYFLYGEPLKEEFDRVWDKILASKDYWRENLKVLYDSDKDRIEASKLDKALKLSLEILNDVPPSKNIQSRSDA